MVRLKEYWYEVDRSPNWKFESFGEVKGMTECCFLCVRTKLALMRCRWSCEIMLLHFTYKHNDVNDK